MQTTAGSWALLRSTIPKDAYAVSRLHDAGAVVLWPCQHERVGFYTILAILAWMLVFTELLPPRSMQTTDVETCAFGSWKRKANTSIPNRLS